MTAYNGTDGNENLIGTNDDDIFYSSKGEDYLSGAGGYDRAIIDYTASALAGASVAHTLSYQYGGLYGSFRGASGSGYKSTTTIGIEEIEFRGSVATDRFFVELTNVPSPWRLSLDAGGGR